MELVASEWGKAKTFPLPLVTYGATDWLSGVTLALGDIQIAVNGGAYVDIPLNQLTVVADHVLITLSNANMQFKYAIVRVKDQDATKIFEDTGAILTTTMHAWNQMLFTLIESQRGSHTGIHDIFYWDPVGGSDSNSGETFHEAKLTYNFNGSDGIYSLINANEHQIIIGLPNASGGPTTVNEYVEIDKAYTFLRCPGRDFLIEPTHNESYAILASAEGVELSGMRVKTKVSGSQDGIGASGDFTSIRKVWVDYSQGSGIKIDNASSCLLDDFLIQDAAQGGSGHALHILGDASPTERNIIGAGKIFSNGNGGGGADGVRIDGGYCLHNFITGGSDGLYIHDNTGYGIQEVNGADETIIVGPTIHIGHNTLGDEPQLIGSESTAQNYQQWGKQEDLELIPTTSPAIIIGAAHLIGDKVKTINEPLKLTIGATETLEYQWLDEDGDPVDIAGYVFKFGVKENLGDAAETLGPIVGTIDDAVNGRFSFSVATGAAVLKGLYEISVDISGARHIMTKAGGVRFEIVNKIVT